MQQHPAPSPKLRLRAYAELAPYVEARRKSIEVRIDFRQSLQVNVIDYSADVPRGIDEKVVDPVDNVVPLSNTRAQ